MSYDLTSHSGDTLHLTIYDWSRVLWIAERHGWQPAMPDIDYSSIGFGMKSYYIGNDNHQVETDDAANLAEAVRRALVALPTEDVAWPERLPSRLADPAENTFIGAAKQAGSIVQLGNTGYLDLAPEGYFANADGRRLLQEVIDFCVKGPFTIG